MAFAIFHNNHWCVDFTGPDGHRQRRIVGDGSSKKAAEAEAKLLAKQIREIRQQRLVPHLADFEFVVGEWLKSKKHEISKHGHERYCACAGHWRKIFGELGLARFYMLDEALVEEYRNRRLQEPHTKPKTVHTELTALRTLCVWAADHGYINGNPARKVKKPKLPKSLPYAYSEAHQQAVLDASRGDPSRHLMICLGLYGGLRTAGVASLKVEDVELKGDQPQLRVREKGEKERIIPIHPRLLEAFRRCPAATAEYWFGPMTESEVGALSGELCSFIRRVTGLKGLKARFHNLRHSFATNLIRGGVPLNVVKDLLGHASITTTTVYLSTAGTDARSAISRLPT